MSKSVEFEYPFMSGMVRIYLHDGCGMVQLSSHQDTDEGYTSSTIKFILCEDTVEAQMSGESADCDGRSDWYEELECRIIEDDEGYHLEKNKYGHLDKWTTTDAGRRDHSAEAMGY